LEIRPAANGAFCFFLFPGILVNLVHHAYVYKVKAPPSAAASSTNEVAMAAHGPSAQIDSTHCGGVAGRTASSTPAYPLRL
jgi:hypothetical protein